MFESVVAGPVFSANRKFALPMVTLSDRQQLLELLPKLIVRFAPQWPLKDFVAVNPLHGYNDMNLLQAMQDLQLVRDAELLMPIEHYRSRLQSGTLSKEDIAAAYEHVQEGFEVLFETFRIRKEEIVNELDRCGDRVGRVSKEYQTVAEQVPYQNELRWSDVIIEEISRYCASVYSESGAAWKNPWKHRGLYASWLAAKQLDRRMEWLGLANFRQMIQELPELPVDSIATILRWFDIPQQHWKGFLQAQWYSLVGWVSYIQGKNFGNSIGDLDENDLVGLLAIRLAYDVCLAQHLAGRVNWRLLPIEASTKRDDSETRQRLLEDLTRYCGLVASELQYRKGIRLALRDRKGAKASAAVRSKFQFVFCIDVRSEVIRRHLEEASSEFETLGFAGFFGLPFQLRDSGSDEVANQCPVLLTPKFTVDAVDRIDGSHADHCERGCKPAEKKGRTPWWSIQQLANSATACFGFVEALGISYAPRLIDRMLAAMGRKRGSRLASAEKAQSQKLLKRKEGKLVTELNLAQKVSFAKSILSNLGVNDRLGSVVIFVGHGSESTNNPFQSSLDCGACGGHSGESNARMAAQLLNDPAVRQGLQQVGINVPADCWFIAGLHNTTTDEITLLDEHDIPHWVRSELELLSEKLPVASRKAMEERNLRFGHHIDDNASRRAVDWSEVRPEWGLVNNAAFIAAPRELTKGKSFDGRVFLHSYDPTTDTDGSILELILTAPVVVAHWINTQYYFSTVDPVAFGSGNKVLHSVVGGLGVVEGNGGDLRTGLPWQSVHDGKRFQHEPLRLSVVLYAAPEAIDRVISAHSMVRNLVDNGWIQITSWQDNDCYERLPGKSWREYKDFKGL